MNRHPTGLWDVGSLVGIFGSFWWTIMTFIAYFLHFPEGTSHVFFNHIEWIVYERVKEGCGLVLEGVLAAFRGFQWLH